MDRLAIAGRGTLPPSLVDSPNISPPSEFEAGIRPRDKEGQVHTFPRSRVKMVCFLKKPWKHPKPTPPENPGIHQTADIDTECEVVYKGEYRSREDLELMKRVGLIRPWH